MRNELEQKLKERYPLVFRDLRNKDISARQSCMVFGIECGDGWFEVIDDLCSKIEPLIAKMVDSGDEQSVLYGHPCASQVKEKFAGLRFYMTWATQEIQDLINEAEDKSYKTCEGCGKSISAGINSGSWIYALCEDCYGKPK